MLGRFSKRPDLEVTSVAEGHTCGFRMEELRAELEIPLRTNGHDRYRSMAELRTELQAVRAFVRQDERLAELVRCEADVDEIAARMHQLLTGQPDDRLHDEQRRLYGTDQERFVASRVR